MEPLIIEATEITPRIYFNPEPGDGGKYILEMSGESRPENARTFYEKILRWLDNYKKHLSLLSEKLADGRKRKIRFKLKMDYFNSLSSKYLLDIFDKLEEIEKSCPVDMKVIWVYEQGDEEMQEAGLEFKQFTSLVFHLSELRSGEVFM